jgi:hypothetical protein
VPGWVHPLPRPHKHITTTARGQGEENGLWHVRGPVKMDTWSPKWVGLLHMAQGKKCLGKILFSKRLILVKKLSDKFLTDQDAK